MEGAYTRGWRALTLATLALALSALASCGGGAGITLDPNPNPNPGGGTSLTGQVQQDSGARVASAAGWGVGGATVALLDPSTGAVVASQNADGGGHFSFSSLTPGQRLLRVGFSGRHDLDGDGTIDAIEVLLPVQVQTGANNAVANFSAVDGDNDGQPDGVLLRLDLSGAGRANHELREIQCRNDTMRGDEDGDGILTDEQPRPDVDNDGIPDDASGRENSLHGGVIHGEISAIGDGSVTVNGIVFRYNEDTKWRIHGQDGPARPAQFTVGTDVLVRGLWNGERWIALGVMRVGAHNADNPGHGNGHPGDGDGDLPAVQRFGGEITALSDTSLSIGDGHSFLVGERTLWFTENGEATAEDFAVGDMVVVKAELAADGAWTALAVYRPGADDPIRPPRPHDPGVYDGAFRGNITALTADSLTIASFTDPATGVANGETHTFVVTERTQWYAADGSVVPISEFAVGDPVGVKAMRTGDDPNTANTPAGGAWIALAVMAVGNVQPPPPPPADDKLFFGTISELTETSLTIAPSDPANGLPGEGLTFAVDSSTKWILANNTPGSAADFAVGDVVTVRGTISADGSWIAMGVMQHGTQPPPDNERLFFGAITELTETSLTIQMPNSPAGANGSMSFAINTLTAWILADGTLGSAADFAVGESVTVKGKIDPSGVWYAAGVMAGGSGDPGDPTDPNQP